MTWKGVSPIVHLLHQNYEKAIKVLSPELETYLPFWRDLSCCLRGCFKR
jgi:hypothetical protein